MGLDMFMRQVEKVSEDELKFLEGFNVHNYEDLPPGITFMHKDDFDREAEIYSDLIPYISEIKAIDKFFDWKRCWMDHDIKEDDNRTGSSYAKSGVSFSFASGKRIDMTQEEYDAYIYDSEVMIYAWKSEEVDYWRKYYDLHDYIEKVRITSKMVQVKKSGTTPTEEEMANWVIENCGYYELSLEERQKIAEYLKTNGEEVGDYLYDENAHFFYHAWW